MNKTNANAENHVQNTPSQKVANSAETGLRNLESIPAVRTQILTEVTRSERSVVSQFAACELMPSFPHYTVLSFQ